ncbi:MAG: NUDIX domain-containing protein [Alphaproteobacteria bacterium]|nr:MAG: NUDIX domain-containing protein [Alphaproteobacteria bacterium]
MGAGRKAASLVTTVLRPWWRLTRGLTLGAQGVVLDSDERVLLVRHGYRSGWFFPGGGVERHETLEEALRRELLEETGVRIAGPVHLHGLFANIENFPGDHIAVFVVREWEQAAVPPPNAEIVEQGFFALDRLPSGTEAGTRRRLEEIMRSKKTAPRW